ncbi:MAG TPA: hypothetical protein VGO07_07490 [Candidatus Saccharimonadales bacterium]|jgi:hypothetical protein|nr:hypothetical protein [Candidatus Saccharimonadales bacterium]
MSRSSTATAERPRHRSPEATTGSRLRRVAAAVRDLALARRETAPRAVIDHLPFGVFEQHDSAHNPIATTRLGYGEHQKSSIQLDATRPIAAAPEMYGATGLPHTTVIGLIKGEFYKPNPHDPQHDAKRQLLDTANTVYVLKTEAPGRQPVATFLGFDMLQKVRQLHAAGERVDLEKIGAAQIKPGKSVPLGRGKQSWWAYDANVNSRPGDPDFLISKVQATGSMDKDGNVFIVDGDVNGKSYFSSKNGTEVKHGGLAGPAFNFQTTEMPAYLVDKDATTIVPNGYISEAAQPAQQFTGYPVIGADPWAQAEQNYTPFVPTPEWQAMDPHAPYHSNN